MQSLVIDRLGHRGDGIAPGPVYVARALPGEAVTGEIRDGRLSDPAIVTASPDRVVPPCPHYAACGGCALMHASDGFVARWKAGVVRTALAARDLPAPIVGIATSPPRSRRRAVLSARRRKSGVLVGFHARASDAITPIPACRVLVPEIVAALPTIEALARAGASRSAELSVHVTHGPAGLDVAVEGGKPVEPALFDDLSSIASRGSLARLTWSGAVVVQARPPYQLFGDARVVPPPGAFLQATKEGEAALTASVLDAVAGAARVADLFAGCGTFALPLSWVAEVHAVEGAAELGAAADAAWRDAAGRRALRTETRDLFRRPLRAADLSRFDAVVLDPPRAGAEAQSREISASTVERVAMVSCNPVSFARDVGFLAAAGFAMDWIRIVDQFRWSPHVEIVARLSR